MKHHRHRYPSYGLPWLPSRGRLERTLSLVEATFAEQRQLAEDLTRELIAGTVTPDRWSDAMRGAYEATWQGYAAWWGIMGGRAKRDQEDDDCEADDERCTEEKDE